MSYYYEVVINDVEGIFTSSMSEAETTVMKFRTYWLLNDFRTAEIVRWTRSCKGEC